MPVSIHSNVGLTCHFVYLFTAAPLHQFFYRLFIQNWIDFIVLPWSVFVRKQTKSLFLLLLLFLVCWMLFDFVVQTWTTWAKVKFIRKSSFCWLTHSIRLCSCSKRTVFQCRLFELVRKSFFDSYGLTFKRILLDIFLHLPNGRNQARHPSIVDRTESCVFSIHNSTFHTLHLYWYYRDVVTLRFFVFSRNHYEKFPFPVHRCTVYSPYPTVSPDAFAFLLLFVHFFFFFNDSDDFFPSFSHLILAVRSNQSEPAVTFKSATQAHYNY